MPASSQKIAHSQRGGKAPRTQIAAQKGGKAPRTQIPQKGGKHLAAIAAAAATKKRHRFRPGVAAHMESKRLQRRIDLIFPRATVVRVIRELADVFMMGVGGDDDRGIRWTKGALDALRMVAEAFLDGVITDAITLTVHAGRKTLQPEDIRKALEMREHLHPAFVTYINASRMLEAERLVIKLEQDVQEARADRGLSVEAAPAPAPAAAAAAAAASSDDSE